MKKRCYRKMIGCPVHPLYFLSAFAVFLTFSAPQAHAEFNIEAVDWAITELCGHISGHLGGLLVTVAAFGAIVAAAFGSYRAFHGAIITAVGAFAIGSIMSLYFPTVDACRKGVQNKANTGATAGRETGSLFRLTAPENEVSTDQSSSANGVAAEDSSEPTDPFEKMTKDM